MEKESFILYNSFYEPIKELKNEQLGKLLRAIFNYNISGEITQDKDIIVAFMFIKNQLDLDKVKWEETKEKRRLAGIKGMESRWNNKTITNYNKNNKTIKAITKITDNDNVNVNDNVIIKENIKRKDYFDNKTLNDLFIEFLQVRKKLKAVNSDRAIKMLLNKLEPYEDNVKIRMIEQSIVHSWKDVYELKNKEPSWFNKKIDKEQSIASEQEQEEIEKILEGFRK